MNEKAVKCRICNKEIGRKGFPIHLKSHSTDFKSYVKSHLKDFPEWGLCEICGKLTKRSKENQKGLTCSSSCRGKRNGKLAIESGRFKGKNNPATRKYVKEKISKSQKEHIKKYGAYRQGAILSKETKQKIGKSNKGKLSGKNNPMYGKKHTPEAIKKIFKHRKMNRFERKVADLLKLKGIKYHFQFFINEGDLCKSYDFKIKGKPIIIEADGDYWHGGPGLEKYHDDVLKTQKNDEIKTKLAESRGYKVFRIWESEFNEKVLNQIFI